MIKKNNKRKSKKKKINWKFNLSVYWSFLREYKLLFFKLLFITFIFEGLLVADKYLFKVVIDNGTKFVSHTLPINNFINILYIIAAVFVIIIFIRTISSWLKVHFLLKLDTKIIYDLKKKYFNHILGLDYNFHTTHKTGSLISRIGRGSNAVENMTDTLAFQFAPMIFQLIVVGISLAYFSWVPAIVLIITVFIFISYSFYIQHIQQESKILHNKSEDFEKGFVGDVFTNIESIKYFGKENIIKNKFEKKSEDTQRKMAKYFSYFKWFDSGQVFILGVGMFFLIYFPIVSFLNREISLGTLSFIYMVYGNVVGTMFSFVWGMRNFYKSMADFQDLFEYGKLKNDIKDKPSAKNLKIKEGMIEFKDVNFNYKKRKIFENFNLKINKNEKIALVGHSGCGKTTLLKLLYRLYDVKSGEVLIDNKNIKEFNQESLRSEMSIVPQECILFDDTIYNNIKFANFKLSKKEIFKAIKFAQLDKIIKQFPDKEKTIVGERGVKLSGGEKQRVSIARAILANKKVLVLDEATSSLDSETEHEIQKDLQKLLQGRTSIIIAHRLSTIMNADRIIVMKKGKIVQQGKHLDLINKSGEYQKLWNLQKGGYIK